MMNNGLEQNLLLLPSCALNSEIKDLQTRIEDGTSVALQCACQSWNNHLAMAQGGFTNVISHLHAWCHRIRGSRIKGNSHL